MALVTTTYRAPMLAPFKAFFLANHSIFSATLVGAIADEKRIGISEQTHENVFALATFYYEEIPDILTAFGVTEDWLTAVEIAIIIDKLLFKGYS